MCSHKYVDVRLGSDSRSGYVFIILILKRRLICLRAVVLLIIGLKGLFKYSIPRHGQKNHLQDHIYKSIHINVHFFFFTLSSNTAFVI
jgi:hypothetical protein